MSAEATRLVAAAPSPKEVRRRRAMRKWNDQKVARALGLQTVAEVRRVVYTSESS